MPELTFQVVGVEAGARGLTPLLLFKLRVTKAPGSDPVQAVMLRTQIQFEAARRSYAPDEKEQLGEVFGTPDRWGQTLRNKLWTLVDISIPAFDESAEVLLPVPCTFDLNILSAKYFFALEGGEVPLLFLFSGTIFHATPEGRLQVHQISWESECGYRMPVSAWQDLMEGLFPRTAWIYLHRDVFDRLYALRRRRSLQTWDATIEHLLARDGMEREERIA